MSASNQPTTLPYPLDLGPLGHVEGLTLVSTPSTSSPASGSTQCHYFGGLPYALPPTGQYRFRPPRPLPAGYKYGTYNNRGRFAGRTALCPQPDYRSKGDRRPWDEDCLQLNIWIPAGEPPSTKSGNKGRWPVFFFIHGGWLQFGTANNPPAVNGQLLSESSLKAVIVMPAYRLNAFGFLASKELAAEADRDGDGRVGNMGFWDQRTALEWTKRWIHLFGGDGDRITVAGYSAGSHSTWQQLAHDLDRPEGERCIGRAMMLSNGPGVQPKAMEEQQEQFDEVLQRLKIPLELSTEEKLQRLRAVSVEKLVDIQNQMRISEFRALSDGRFVSKDSIKKINDGTYARKIKERGIRIMNGECAEEWNVYGSWRTPSDSYDALYRRMVADYPEKAVKKIVAIYFPDKKLPPKYKNWPDAFGKVYSDMQVYSMERGFAKALVDGGLTVGKDLLRYRIEWRAKCVNSWLPLDWGVTHSTDLAIWFWGNGWERV